MSAILDHDLWVFYHIMVIMVLGNVIYQYYEWCTGIGILCCEAVAICFGLEWCGLTEYGTSFSNMWVLNFKVTKLHFYEVFAFKDTELMVMTNGLRDVCLSTIIM